MPALRDLIHSHKAREDVEITLFSIGVLVCLWGFAHSAGCMCKHVMKTPPLLGYLLAGICFRNIGGAVLLFAQAKTGIGLGEEQNRPPAGTADVATPPPQAAPHAAEPPSLVLIPADISSLVRTFGLATILMIAGGEIDFDRIRKMGGVCARLTVLPGVSEAFAVAFVSRYLFGFDWPWGLVLGFILGAVSPAVVCGGMFALQKRGFGVAKGIPSLVVCAASLDDVVAISGFTTSLGLAIAGLVEDRLLRLLSSVEDDESEEVDVFVFRASRSWNRVDADAAAAEELRGQRFATHYTEANYVENAGVLPSLAPRGISRFLFGKPHVPAHPSSHWRGLLHGPTNLLLGAALGICLGYVYAKVSRIVLQCTLFMPAQQQERRRRPRPKKPTVPAPETLDFGIGRGGGRRSLRESVRSTKMKAMARLPRGLQVETGSPQELGLGSGDDGGGTTTAQPRIIATRAEAAIAGLVFCTGCGVAMAAVHLQYSGAGFLACLFFTCAFSQFSRAGETDGTSRAVFSSVSSVGETTLSGDYDVEKMNNSSSRARLHDGEEDRRTVLGAPSELLVGVKDQHARGPRGPAALEEDDVTIAVPSQSPLGESSGVRRMMTFEMEDITARAAEAGSAGREKKDSSSPPPKTSSKRSQGGIGLFSSSASSDDEQAASYRAQIDQDSPDLDGDFDVDEAIQAARDLASGRSPAAGSRDARTRESQLSESDFSPTTTTPASFAHDDEFDVLASLDEEVPLIAVVVQCLTWIWELFAEPLLFGIIGTVVDVRRLHLPTLPKAAFLILFCVFFVRVPAAMAALSSCGGTEEVKLSFKERLFVGLSWMPKATVQAALGSVPLDRIHAVQKHYAGVAKMKSGRGVASLNSVRPATAASAETLEQLNRLANWGEIIVTTAVLSILLTAPIGLLVVSKLGPVMLERGNGKNEVDNGVRLHETAATSGDGAVGTNTARE